MGINATNGEGFMPSPFSNGVPRDYIGWNKSLFASPGLPRMKMCGRALGLSWWMESFGKSLGQKPLGPAGPQILAFGLPWGLHSPWYTLGVPHIVPVHIYYCLWSRYTRTGICLFVCTHQHLSKLLDLLLLTKQYYHYSYFPDICKQSMAQTKCMGTSPRSWPLSSTC